MRDEEQADVIAAYSYLSSRQRRLLVLYAGGKTVNDCAAIFGVAGGTIYQDLARIRGTFQTNTNAGAVVLALAAGLIEMPRVGEEGDECPETTN